MRSNGRPRRWQRRAAAAAGATIWLVTVPAAAASPARVPHSRDTLLPLAQVQSIVSDGGGPTLHANPLEDRTSPWVDHSRDPELSAPCRHFANEDEAFGSSWVNFASTRYSGSSNVGVSQHIAVYPDADTARRVFEALTTAAQQCHLHPSPGVLDAGDTLTEPDAVTLMARYPETVNGPGSVSVYALRAQVLVEVGAPHMSTDPRIAQTVLALITQKIPAR
ncbi:sensor domain-containing protein [Mycobacteroides abscessus]|uniref:sensor domain-containing protein n=1 Tax=Mycobacteroides abscessus TaxID=36809 RepID=UPI0013F61A87|nr:sensor domain-containing protein [Mycobacteroides abscessus]